MNIPSSVLHHALLESKKVLSHNIHVRRLKQVLSHVLASGLFSDSFISSKLVLLSLSNYCDLSFSRSIFYQIENPNVYAYNFMLQASQSSAPIDSIHLYKSMVNNCILPDDYSFTFILKASGRLMFLDKGQELHCSSLKMGYENSVFVQNCLVSMYFACNAVEFACRVFQFIPVFIRDVVSWNSMISGCLDCGFNSDALKVFVEFLGEGGEYSTLDEVTFIGALSACGRTGFVELGKKIHGFLIGNGFLPNIFLGSSLVDMYCKCGQIRCARKLFEKIPHKSLVTWTSLIVGYAQSNMFNEAIYMFREMQTRNLIADSMLAASVISSCGHVGSLDMGKWMHTYCEMNGIHINKNVSNALMEMYLKCGCTEAAGKIFDYMIERDVFSWTTMISGLAMNGNSEKAFELFKEMEKSNKTKPNEVTFLGVLSACSHGGFVNEGLYYFKSMIHHYYVAPRLEHYGCVVDLLGRANLLNEAFTFINAMPIEPDKVMWRSLLFSCKMHGNVELAELAITKIKELEPLLDDSSCILLANAYSLVSRWDDVNQTRKHMNDWKIRKKPGRSSVEVNGFVQEFFAEYDCSYCKHDAVYETNTQVHGVIQSEGSTMNDFISEIW